MGKEAETNEVIVCKALPNVSMIVAALNSELTIDECLRSILELDYPEQLLEVLVIDGCSKDKTVEHVSAHPVRLISKQLNTPEAYNLALKVVNNDILGFIDSDAKIEREWLRKLISHLDDPKVAGASGSIATWNKEKLIPRCIGYELSYRYSRVPKEVPRAATMNLVLKKKTIEEMGGFDEALPTQYDTDMGVRITQKGYKIVYDSDALCYHHHRSTLLGYFKQQYRYGQNTWKVYLKHRSLVKGDKITNWWMNVQPLLYTVATVLLLIGLIANFNLIALSLFVSIIVLMAFVYIYSAAKIARTYHDLSAAFIFFIYFTRAIAWTLGGATSFLRSALSRIAHFIVHPRKVAS